MYILIMSGFDFDSYLNYQFNVWESDQEEKTEKSLSLYCPICGQQIKGYKDEECYGPTETFEGYRFCEHVIYIQRDIPFGADIEEIPEEDRDYWCNPIYNDDWVKSDVDLDKVEKEAERFYNWYWCMNVYACEVKDRAKYLK